MLGDTSARFVTQLTKETSADSLIKLFLFLWDYAMVLKRGGGVWRHSPSRCGVGTNDPKLKTSFNLIFLNEDYPWEQGFCGMYLNSILTSNFVWFVKSSTRILLQSTFSSHSTMTRFDCTQHNTMTRCDSTTQGAVRLQDCRGVAPSSRDCAITRPPVNGRATRTLLDSRNCFHWGLVVYRLKALSIIMSFVEFAEALNVTLSQYS